MMAVPVKSKPPSHGFRVSTDRVRQEYRRQRTAALGDQLDRRTKAAADIASSAAVTIDRDEGYAVCPPGRFEETSGIVALARGVMTSVDLEEKRSKANKPFMVGLIAMDEVTLDSPLLRFALRPDIVASAARYLGVVPILQYANVMYSSHVAAEPSKSQLYHCDSDEAEQVKVFILCEDVTAATGPLTIVPASQSQVVRDRTGYKYKSRLTDEAVHAAFGHGLKETALIGAPGTTGFIDTSRCLHYGSRIADAFARRLVVMLQYITPTAFILPEDDFREGAKFRRLASPDHDEITSMVLGAV